MKKKFVIKGGAGFIGYSLYKNLNKKIILKNKHSGDFFVSYSNIRLIKNMDGNQKLL